MKSYILQAYFYGLLGYNWFYPNTPVENLLKFSIWILIAILLLTNHYLYRMGSIPKGILDKSSALGKGLGFAFSFIMTVYCVWYGWLITAGFYLFVYIGTYILVYHRDMIDENHF